MPVIRDEPVRGLYGISVGAASDADFSVSRAATNLRVGVNEVLISVEATTGARLGFTPKVREMWWYDDSADSWHDLLGPNKDVLFSDLTGTRQFTLAVADFLYINLAGRIGGFSFAVDSVIFNDVAATMAFEYLGGGGVFATQAVTGFASDPLKVSEIMTLNAIPSEAAWVSAMLSGASHRSLPPGTGRGHWCRLSTNTLLNAVEIEQIRTFIPHIGSDGDLDTASIDMMFLKAATEYTIPLHPDVQSLEYIAQDAAISTLSISFVIRDR